MKAETTLYYTLAGCAPATAGRGFCPLRHREPEEPAPRTLTRGFLVMTASIRSSLAATLISTAAGTGAWLLGITRAIWPSHPQLAVLFLTIAVYVVVKLAWPAAADGSTASR